jgi:hypothetical protein
MAFTVRWLAASVSTLILLTGSVFATMPASPQPARLRLPKHLSESSIFQDLTSLAPARGFIPYEINVPSWSDGAAKRRWMMLPGDGSNADPSTDRIVVKPGLPWAFPSGAVFVQHFDWPPDRGGPGTIRRLETRVLVRDHDAGVYGFSYRWNAAGTDATLVEEAATETLTTSAADGPPATQVHDYPAPDECLVCHNQSAGGVLGVNYGQIDRAVRYTPDRAAVNQFVAWNRANLLSKALDRPQALDPWNLVSLPRWIPVPFWAISVTGHLAPIDGPGRLEHRARSYLEANCSSCHAPGIVNADWDARASTDLGMARLVGAPARIPMFDARNIIEPGSPERSLLYLRVASALPGLRMPPIGRNTVDAKGAELLAEWIRSLPAQSAH